MNAYADDDGIPEMESGVIVDGILYITMQRLNNFAPSETAYVALFDTATDTEIDTGVANDDNVLGIPLPIKNPGSIQYLEENDTIYVQGAGNAYATPPDYTGGIVTIDPSSYAVELLVDDGETTGNISGMVIANADKGYFIGYAGWGAGQLEQELADNTWLSGPASSKIVFDTPSEQRWEAAAALLGVDLNLLSSDTGHA